MHFNSKQLKILKEYQPVRRVENSLLHAAIAIILREGKDGLEFLLMQRAQHKNDPWSGQMSFPGGKIDPKDNSAKAAAIRETEEEVGITLLQHDYIGQLDDLYGIKVDDQYSVHVSCFVFMPTQPLNPVGNYEVADLVWLPFSYLEDVSHSIEFFHPYSAEMRMPAVMINAEKDQILWGLSLRILSTLYALLDWPMAVLSKQEIAELSEIEKRTLDKKAKEMIIRRG